MKEIYTFPSPYFKTGKVKVHPRSGQEGPEEGE
jgi:hypothetical protein